MTPVGVQNTAKLDVRYRHIVQQLQKENDAIQKQNNFFEKENKLLQTEIDKLREVRKHSVRQKQLQVMTLLIMIART